MTNHPPSSKEPSKNGWVKFNHLYTHQGSLLIHISRALSRKLTVILLLPKASTHHPSNLTSAYPVPTLRLLPPLNHREWPHRQCVGLAYPRTSVRATVAAASVAICSPHLQHAIRWAQCRVRSNGQSIGSTVSYAVVHSWLWSTATRNSHWATSVALLQVVDNWPHILW